MTAKEFNWVRAVVDNEGFHYAFVGYSNFGNVKDEEFHRLRLAYLEAMKKLADYLALEP